MAGSGGRALRPDLGRQISPDRKGYGPDQNRYRYCLNSPPNRADPSGLDDITIPKSTESKSGLRYVTAHYSPGVLASLWGSESYEVGIIGYLLPGDDELLWVRDPKCVIPMSTVKAAVKNSEIKKGKVKEWVQEQIEGNRAFPEGSQAYMSAYAKA